MNMERIQYFISHNRIMLSTLSAFCLFIFSRPNLFSISAGALLLFGGEFLRTWSSGHINKNRSLATGGPYGYTRNPLYAGNFLLAAGFAVISWNLIIIILVLLLFVVIYYPVIKSEEKKLLSLFGGEYKVYQEKVPRFVPRLSSAYKQSVNSFDWQLVKKHREFNTWFGIAMGILLFIMKTFLPFPFAK